MSDKNKIEKCNHSIYLSLIEDLLFYAGVALASGMHFVLTNLQKKKIKLKNNNSRRGRLLVISGEYIFFLKVHSKEGLIAEDILRSSNSLLDEIKYLHSPTCDIDKVNHLSIGLDEDFPLISSPLHGDNKFRSVYGGQGFLPDESFIYVGSFVICYYTNAVFGPNMRIENTKKWLRAGPRRNIFFDPSTVKAAIVTCGGLCPGLNVVIRELFMTLRYNYKVKDVYGIKYGYKGFYSYEWVKLDNENVKNIHLEGGTMLGSSRGGFQLEQISEELIKRGINQVYCLGGDGTHKGVLELFKEMRKQKRKISVVGIPKTIDNDIPIIDKSFGFDTAVSEAIHAIRSAYVEAHCAEFGVGLVRLMGRYAGFIAMEAVNASREVNVCLIPEFKFELYGQHGLLEYCFKRLETKGTLVIVVAEGAGEAMLDYKVEIAMKDASGNVITEDVGQIIKKELSKYCKEKKMSITLKYIDPTYMIRTVQANPHDKTMCTQWKHKEY